MLKSPILNPFPSSGIKQNVFEMTQESHKVCQTDFSEDDRSNMSSIKEKSTLKSEAKEVAQVLEGTTSLEPQLPMFGCTDTMLIQDWKSESAEQNEAPIKIETGMAKKNYMTTAC